MKTAILWILILFAFWGGMNMGRTGAFDPMLVKPLPALPAVGK